MDSARWQRVQDLFLAARAWPSAERDARLAEACADLPDLIDDVRALLEADARAGVLDALAPRLRPIDAVLVDSMPDPIGAYRIIRELGRGGMGVVYLGERADGQFEHRVAIKLIRTTDPGDPLHRRFLTERQILAGLQHPNIARLLDGGITDRGLPYLVMEYVDGLPITEYCDTKRLDVRARLRLFGDVCAAVQHAHRNLVIHRDLKPGNILVTADGRVHLLDFGIAKLLEPTPGRAHVTATRMERAMTPGYASPEQVRGDPLTTASDIYSLGTLLYELLTGSRPYALENASTAEMMDAICERDPERPSVRAARAAGPEDGFPAQRAERRGTTAERLRRQLEGDLDSIVLMAMRKEANRRYASADLLREDIERHLHGFSVIAHRGSGRYRFEKFVRRHRAGFAAVSLAAISLLVGLGAALWQARVAGLERDSAEHARTQAELALAQSQEITDFLMDLFRTGESGESADAVTVLDLMRRGTARADQLAGQPAVQARLLDVLGQLSLRLGRLDEAHRLLDEAVSLRRARPGADSLDLAASLINFARVYRSRGDFLRARALVAEALMIRSTALPPDHPELADAIYELGWISFGLEQESYYRWALRVLRARNAQPQRQLEIMHGIATNLRRRGRLAEAVAADHEALAFAERAFGRDAVNTGHAMIHLADQVADLEGDIDEAERLYERGLALMRRGLGDDDVRLVHGLHGLAGVRSQRGALDDAEALLRGALSIRVAATGPDHPEAAESTRMLAEQVSLAGRYAEADSLAHAALEIVRRTQGDRHPNVATLYLPVLARIAERRGRPAQADRIYREALAMWNNANVVRDYGRFLVRTGEFEAAEEHLLASLAEHERTHERADHPATLETKRALMELYERWGRPELVERYRVPPGRFIAY